MTKSLTSGILFSAAVRAAVVTKLFIVGIPPLNSCILAWRAELVAKLPILGISLHHLSYLNQ